MFVLVFKSTHDALKSEKILKNAGYRSEIIPTPKEISSECGFAILLKDEPYQLKEKLIGFDLNCFNYETYEKLW